MKHTAHCIYNINHCLPTPTSTTMCGLYGSYTTLVRLFVVYLIYILEVGISHINQINHSSLSYNYNYISFSYFS